MGVCVAEPIRTRGNGVQERRMVVSVAITLRMGSGLGIVVDEDRLRTKELPELARRGHEALALGGVKRVERRWWGRIAHCGSEVGVGLWDRHDVLSEKAGEIEVYKVRGQEMS